MSKIIIAFLLFILPSFLAGQVVHDQGFPWLRNFSPAEYKGHTQNFAVVSDHHGLTYFGNFAGVLQFDGQGWRLISTEKTTRVSALAVDSTGTVYVGALGEIGFLAPDQQGELHFSSLLKDQGSAHPAFGEVSNIFVTDDGLNFISRDHILKVKGEKLSVWNAPAEITGSWSVNGTIYLQMKGLGLVSFAKDQVNPAETDHTFSDAVVIEAMLPYSDNRILIATGSQGLFLLENGRVSGFNTPVNDFLKEHQVTCGIRLSDGSFALGTLRQGIVLINQQGEVLQWIDKKALLQDHFVQALYAPNNNTVWVALNNGISLIGTPSQLSFFDEGSGLEGEVNQILRVNHVLYVATYQGLYYLDTREYFFKPVSGIISSCWGIIPYNDHLLAATSHGVFLVSGQKASLIKDGFALSIVRSADPSVVYVGEMRGFYALKNQANRWIPQRVEGTNEEIRELQLDSKGNIWGMTLTHGIFRYTPGSGEPKYYSVQDGLPDHTGNAVYPLGDKMVVSTRNGVYELNETSQSFETLKLQKDTLSGAKEWYSMIIQNSDGSLWVNNGDETHIRLLKKNGDNYLSGDESFLPLSDLVIRSIYSDANKVTWFGGPDGLIRYDPAVPNENIEPGQTLIRKITLNNDSVIFSGYFQDKAAGYDLKDLEFSYSNNSLRFDFSIPYYTPRGGNQYQVWLEGFEDTWSEWSSQSHKEYTNIPFGKYRFHVKAKNLYGKTASEATAAFQILTPWYASIWAILLYISVLGGVVYLIVVLRNRQLINEKRILEQTITERTEEIVQQKEEIESQSMELANKNTELEKINTAVKSINAEINFENLLLSLLEKMRIIRSVENSTALVYDKNSNAYRYKASIGWDLSKLGPVRLSLEEAENMYLANENEVYEDIFIKRSFSSLDPAKMDSLIRPKSMMILVIKIENKIEAFLIFDNETRENAFDARDISFIRNSKEHIVSAFIRTRILEDLQLTLQNLKDTQNQLIQSEKLASLGELTAGIAHEIQNPLNFVNNFSSLSADLADELLEFLDSIKDKISEDQFADVDEVVGMIKSNVKKINEHGKRAESIVKGMLQHSRGKSGEFELTEINNMVTEYVNLAYHGMKAKDKSFNTAIRTQLDPAVGKASIIPQDLSRVVLNIVNNSCYALNEKTKKGIPGFMPEVVVSTRKINDKIEIRIKDNGTGIPQHVLDKIFNPFFTTKPTGKGTGLGLSMSYDIVTKMHKGKLEVNSKEGEYTEFIITIPERQT
jgi:signal transduction histidine kinase/ligand-binding sensor domain-containing protein